MKKTIEKKPRKQFVILLVCIVTGFIVGYSYNLAEDNREQKSSDMLFQTSSVYREELIEQQERNKQLQEELDALQVKIRDYEQQFSDDDTTYEEQLKEVNRIRLLLGDLEAKGEGIRIQLTDGEYDGQTNPNNYVVHESHIFSLLHELKIAGAEAISINGKRLKANSYISCNGPVITVDGQQFPAPFVIEAVGNPNTLSTALNIPGGMMDQLLMDNVVVEVSEDENINMTSIQQGNS
ncbi:MAG: DUF881 domain-containing protein [Lysinibacillus sp.]